MLILSFLSFQWSIVINSYLIYFKLRKCIKRLFYYYLTFISLLRLIWIKFLWNSTSSTLFFYEVMILATSSLWSYTITIVINEFLWLIWWRVYHIVVFRLIKLRYCSIHITMMMHWLLYIIIIDFRFFTRMMMIISISSFMILWIVFKIVMILAFLSGNVISFKGG